MNSKKREHEKTIFEAFRRVCPDFAGEPTHEEVEQSSDETEFPDVICTTVSGKRVGVETGTIVYRSLFRISFQLP
jgi:hypothetical protein